MGGESTAPRQQTVGLVLPGGGARGAYQAGALDAIAEIVPEGVNPFPVIMGASVGAINAVALATHARNFKRGVDQMVDFWDDLHTSDVYRTDLATIMKGGAQWVASMTPLASLGIPNPRSLLDSAPLGELLRKHIHLDRLDEAIQDGALRAIGVTASSYDRARAITFFQGVEGLEEWVRVRRDGVAVKLKIEHLMASAALPFVFTAQRIGDEYYGDGSLRLTSPLSPAIHCGADRILVIGIRDAKPDKLAGLEPVYPSLGTLSGYLLDTIFMDNLDADIERARRVDHTLSLLPLEQQRSTRLRDIDILVVQPSRDVRDIAREHAHEMPWTIRMLLRRLGVWGRDWRLPSYLLFEPGYCRALIDLGYTDTMARSKEILEFLGFDGSGSPQSGT
ncbi:patatin-like phospholipase family protein [uncultured Hyphomicrobium sp.]|uniref:patatin-like phospholipase family protein n=1 Tax=uncultured Hyphomicrobium sp. TaxID=194373 RepID=UPI0025F0E673|nr:patatin-like phospholipase family protein [uncultured Hyphomicrobium sp.]